MRSVVNILKYNFYNEKYDVIYVIKYLEENYFGLDKSNIYILNK